MPKNPRWRAGVVGFTIAIPFVSTVSILIYKGLQNRKFKKMQEEKAQSWNKII